MSVDDNVVSEEPIDILSYATEILLQSPDNQNCTDFHGSIVVDGAQFVPNVDPCWTCHCQNGVAVMCKSVQCSPPACRLVNIINNECCKFVCIDLPHDTGNFPDGDTNRASFGVRLVASIVTSLIVIFLLVFMVHRIRRRRRTMISIRRLNDERRSENDDLVYMTNADTVDVGFELPPYEDLPPPYSPAKPWDISEESPPPYEPNDGIIRTDEAALPWRQTDPGRDRTAFPHQILSRSFPAEGHSDSCMNRPDSEDHTLQDVLTGDTEMTERARSVSKPGVVSQSPCGHVERCSPRAESPPDACALQSVVMVCNNGSRSSRILQKNARMARILGGHDNDFNGNEMDAVKVTDALLCPDAVGETRISPSRSTQDRTCSNENTLEGTSETADDNTLGPAAGKRLRSVRNAPDGTDHHHSSRDASSGATRKCLLAEAPTETVGAISTANAAWMSSGTTKRRYLDYNRQPPTKIHSNRIWCEL